MIYMNEREREREWSRVRSRECEIGRGTTRVVTCVYTADSFNHVRHDRVAWT